MTSRPNRAAKSGAPATAAPAAASAPLNQSRRQQQRGTVRPPRSKGPAPRSEAANTSRSTGDQAPSIAAAASTSTSKKRKKQESSAGQDTGAGDKARLKVVVRRLPPNLPATVFWKAVGPWVNDGKAGEQGGSASPGRTADWLCFIPGKLKTKEAGGGTSSAPAHRHSRAYIRFLNARHLVDFHQNFDGHVFRDAKGAEQAAVVEFAPYQKVPADSGRRKKRDPRQGTIEDDIDYQAFLESLKAETPASGEQSLAERTEAQLLAHLATSEGAAMAEGAKTTPLLEHLRQQRALYGRRGYEGKAFKAKDKEKSSRRKAPTDAKASGAAKKQDKVRDKGKKKRTTTKKKADAEAAPAASSSKPAKDPDAVSKKAPKGPRSKSKPAIRATEPTPQPVVAPQMILKRQAPAAAAQASTPSNATSNSSRPRAPAPPASARPPSTTPAIPTGPAAGSRGRGKRGSRGGGGGRGAAAA